jgi:hypothetical protein
MATRKLNVLVYSGNKIRVNFIITMLTLVQEMVARLNPFDTASTRFDAFCPLHMLSFPSQARR